MNTDPTHIAICAEYSTHATDQPPVGPCVLRPGHRGHIHQDMRGIQWADQTTAEECATGGIVNFRLDTGEISGCVLPNPRPEDEERRTRLIDAIRPNDSACCVCGGSPVAYRNYRGRPFCGPCADGQVPAAGSGSDDELRARLHAAIRAIGRGEQEIAELRRDNTQLLGEQAACIAAEQQRDRLAATLREVRAELRSRDEAAARQRSACQRALRDVCAVQRVRDLADRWHGQGAPSTRYARELLATLDEVA